MIFNDLLNELECSNKCTPKHFVQNPVHLKCGDLICSTCATENSSKIINCKKCFSSTVKLDQTDTELNNFVEILTKRYVNHISLAIHEVLKNKLNEISGM